MTKMVRQTCGVLSATIGACMFTGYCVEVANSFGVYFSGVGEYIGYATPEMLAATAVLAGAAYVAGLKVYDLMIR